MPRSLWSDRPLGAKLAVLVAAGALPLAAFAVIAVQALQGTGERTEDLLAGAEIVMEPKPLPDTDAAKALQAGRTAAALYRPALAERFEVVRETDRWIVHRRKPSGRSGCAACDGPAMGVAGLR